MLCWKDRVQSNYLWQRQDWWSAPTREKLKFPSPSRQDDGNHLRRKLPFVIVQQIGALSASEPLEAAAANDRYEIGPRSVPGMAALVN